MKLVKPALSQIMDNTEPIFAAFDWQHFSRPGESGMFHVLLADGGECLAEFAADAFRYGWWVEGKRISVRAWRQL